MIYAPLGFVHNTHHNTHTFTHTSGKAIVLAFREFWGLRNVFLLFPAFEETRLWFRKIQLSETEEDEKEKVAFRGPSASWGPFPFGPTY